MRSRVLGRSVLVSFLALASLGLNAINAHAVANDTLIFTPVADAYVDASLPDSSFGTSTSLWVDAQPAKQSFMRFAVSGVSSRTVVGVRLRMFQTDSSPSGGRVFSISSSSWDESVTWNTRPAIDGPQLGSFGAVQPGLPYEVDLGAGSVSGDGAINLAMDSTSTDGARWGSREHTDPPQLIVDLSPKPAPSNVDKFTFNTVADTYVDASQPGSSFGGAGSFWADSSPAKQSFMRFSVSGLSGRSVEDVRLRLYQVDASPEGGRVFSITSNSWTESVTWDTRPPIDGPQLGSFGKVSSGRWYEIDLGKLISGDGTLNLALDSVNSDGARWASRESANAPKLIVSVDKIPGLILDGLSTVVGPNGGSSEPTYYATQHHVALTSAGRLLVVYGRHASGIQLAWRDPGGGWQTDTTGAVTDGQLLSGAGTGDWPSSILVAKDSAGEEHAWAVWARASFLYTNGVSMRRLSNLDSPDGPSVGPVVTVEPAGLGTAKVDLGFETAGSLQRGVVLWTRKTGDSSWAIVTTWFTNLDTDTPTFGSQKVLVNGTGSSNSGTLIPSAQGMRAAIRDGTGNMHLYGHNTASPLTTWWSGVPGVALPTGARVAGVALASGDLAVTAESNTVNHVVTVQTFDSAGKQPKTKLSATGYAQPVLATDGTRIYLLMIRTSDGFVVSRDFNGLTWGPVRVEIGAEGGGNYSWPNTVRQTDGRLRFVVRGPSGGVNQNAVLAFQRIL
ncbi:MAG TPA: DNRLRE domain-containing protein [Actinomycetota bacterium]